MSKVFVEKRKTIVALMNKIVYNTKSCDYGTYTKK